MRFLDVHAMRRERPPPVAWLVEGLRRMARSLLASRPKAGKSLIALALADGVAAGKLIAGIGPPVCEALEAILVGCVSRK